MNPDKREEYRQDEMRDRADQRSTMAQIRRWCIGDADWCSKHRVTLCADCADCALDQPQQD